MVGDILIKKNINGHLFNEAKCLYFLLMHFSRYCKMRKGILQLLMKMVGIILNILYFSLSLSLSVVISIDDPDEVMGFITVQISGLKSLKQLKDKLTLKK